MRVLLVLSLLCGVVCAAPVRMNQVQVIGTHNSYHIAPADAVLGVIGKMKEEWRGALDYTHRPLPEQFEELGIRQIELDVFADPEGGLYSKPRLAGLSGGNGDPDGLLQKPGMKVLHVQDLDFRTKPTTVEWPAPWQERLGSLGIELSTHERSGQSPGALGISLQSLEATIFG